MHTKSHGVGRHVTAALLLVALVPASLVVAAAPQSGIDAAQAQRTSFGKTTYRVVNLTDGDTYGRVAINASGQVAYSYTPDMFQVPLAAYFYDGATIRNIGRLGNDFALVTGLNNAGQVVGQSANAQGQTRSFIWSARRPITEIDMLPGGQYAWQPVINNAGVVAGYMSLPDGNHAYRWSRADGLTDLSALLSSEPRATYPSAINDAGVIVGDGWIGNNRFHAFRWTFGTGIVDIHDVDATDSTAIGIDAGGNIAGNFYDTRTGSGRWRAYVRTPGDGMRALAYGSDDVRATGITAGGRVIGDLSRDLDNYRAFTWTRAGGIVALGTLGGAGSVASGANDRGQVVGSSPDASGRYRAFAWSARLGMIDLNTRLRHAPPGLELYDALAVSDNGAIAARSNTGLVLLKPMTGASCSCPHTVGPIAARATALPGEAVEASVGIAGDRPAAHYKVIWSWGDGATADASAGIAARSSAAGAPDRDGGALARSDVRHTYTAPGVYTVSATVVDDSGASVRVSRKIVVRAGPIQAEGGASGSGHAGPGRAGEGRVVRR